MGSLLSQPQKQSKTGEIQHQPDNLKHNLKILLKNNIVNNDSLKSLEISDFKYPYSLNGGFKNIESEKRYLKYDIQNIIKKYENNIHGGALLDNSDSFINDSEYNSESITTDGDTIEHLKQIILNELSEIQTNKIKQEGGAINKKKKKKKIISESDDSDTESSSESDDDSDTDDSDDSDDSSDKSSNDSSDSEEELDDKNDSEEKSLYSSSDFNSLSDSGRGDALSIFPFNSSEINSSSDHHLKIIRRKI